MAITVFFATPKDDVSSTVSFVSDATISVAPNFQNIITNHKVERGSVISDHAYNQNPVIKIDGVVSSTLIREYTGNAIGSGADRVQQAYNYLKELWKERLLFRVVTEYETFDNCVLKTFTTNFTKGTSDALVFTITVEQLRIADKDKILITQFSDTVSGDAEKTKSGNGTKQDTEEDEFLLDNWFEGFVTGGENTLKLIFGVEEESQ